MLNVVVFCNKHLIIALQSLLDPLVSVDLTYEEH